MNPPPCEEPTLNSATSILSPRAVMVTEPDCRSSTLSEDPGTPPSQLPELNHEPPALLAQTFVASIARFSSISAHSAQGSNDFRRELREATIRWRLAEARKMFREAWERRERRAEKTRLVQGET